MSKQDKNSQCYDCFKSISGKKAIECNDCGEIFCREHIKINESSHSSVCFQCFRKKIHLEVTLEMENQTLEAKSNLSTFKEKLKNCKKDLATKKSNIERHQNQMKINEKTYLRKFENLEKKIEEETKRKENIDTTISHFTLSLSDSKSGNKNAADQLEQIEDKFNSILFELEALKQENNKLRNDINVANAKSKKFIPYIRLRNTLCPSCKSKIKLVFKDEIVSGNKDRESLVESVLREKERFHQKKEEMGISDLEKNEEKKKEACCLIS